MHHPKAITKSPQRCRAKFVGGTLLVVTRSNVLDDPVTGSDVMQQVIAEGMDFFVAQPLAHNDVSAQDWRIRRSSFESSHVTNGTANLIKYLGA